MKLNTNYLSLLLVSVIFLASCSQARYGHLTRKVKPEQKVSQERIVKKTEKPASEEPLMAVTETESVEVEEILADLPVTDASELTVATASEVQKDMPSRDEIKDKALGTMSKFASPMAAKIAKKAVDRMDSKISPDEAQSSDLIYLLKIILIILLILIILDFILSFFPSFVRAILGLVIAILLILWLLDYLS